MTVGDLRKLLIGVPDDLKVVTPSPGLLNSCYLSAHGAGVVPAERYRGGFATTKMLSGGLKASVFLVGKDS